MKLFIILFIIINLFIENYAYPNMRSKKKTTVIGPTCTQGGHNPLPPSGVCPQSNETFVFPGMHDVPSGQAAIHRWAPWFTVEWIFYYVFDPANIPPYFPVPKGNFTFTHGRTYYDDTTSHGRCMREVYDERCIPIFFTDVLSINNNYSCDFLNVGSTQTAYLILHDDRPKGAPECCIIGQPFHPPPRNFSDNLYIKKVSTIEDIDIDWNGLTLDDAGIFLYGFYNKTTKIPYDPIPASRPYVFYMMGAPQIATWMYQKFGDWDPFNKPDQSIWDIPNSCQEATVCPGWS